jgi:glycosyltransferase involved in cell wall biosynthesis
MSRRRAIWVTPFAPDRSGGGGQIRQAHLIHGLAPSLEITLVTPGPVKDESVRSDVARVIELERGAPTWLERPRWMRRAGDLGWALAGRQPREVAAQKGIRAAASKALVGIEAEIVLVQFPGLASLATDGSLGELRRKAHWVLTLDHLLSRMAAQEADLMANRRKRLLFQLDSVRSADYESAAVREYDRVIVVSDQDAVALGDRSKVVTIPNGVDVTSFKVTSVPGQPNLLFSGALYTGPNQDGAQWLVKDVLPLVHAVRPDAQLDIVGADPPAQVLRLADHRNVAVHPDVASLAPFVERARVSLVPLRIGSGTRLKALEAWAAGRPVVGTTIGLEGLGAQSGENALIADTPASFAAAILRILEDGTLANALAAAGRVRAENCFDWRSLARQMDCLLSSPAADGSAGGSGSSSI